MRERGSLLCLPQRQLEIIFGGYQGKKTVNRTRVCCVLGFHMALHTGIAVAPGFKSTCVHLPLRSMSITETGFCFGDHNRVHLLSSLESGALQCNNPHTGVK